MRQVEGKGPWASAILAALVVLMLGLSSGDPASAEPALASIVDDFEDLSPWTATASPGASVELAHDLGRRGRAMRIDFDLGIGGFVIARRPLSHRLPQNYVFAFDVRGEAKPNNLEFKLVDPTGDNVWWAIDRDFEFPPDWERVTFRRSRLRYAWGNSGGEPLTRTGFVEIAITAGSGGKGSVWVENLRFEPRPSRALKTPRPSVIASTSIEGHPPEAATDGDPATSWRSGSVGRDQWIELDFGGPTEFGGLVIDWEPEDHATSYRVEINEDGTWRRVYGTTSGSGRRNYIYLHDTEASGVRLALTGSHRGHGYGVREIVVKPLEFSATPNEFFAAIAADAPPGAYPKYFSQQQTYWTVVGVPGDTREALLNEEGMLEVDVGSFSIEPFLYVDGTLLTWKSVQTERSLEYGYLPIPTVSWRSDGIRLHVTALATGEPGSSVLYARYRVENLNEAHRDVLLFLALRPFQVLPPWQSLNVVGGASRIRSLVASSPQTAWVDAKQPVVSLTPAERFGAATFEEDLFSTYLREGRVPPRAEISDPFGYASGAFEYRLALAPHEARDVIVAVPFHPPAGLEALAPSGSPEKMFAAKLTEESRAWERDLGRVGITLPGPEGERIVRIAKSTLAYMEINRDGPAIQPGSRTYGRSWIRDGTLTSSALLAYGHPGTARDFLRWFATYQLPDGRIPCCIDQRGPDRVPENDSNGQFVYGIATYVRYTRDIGFLWEMWPSVVRAVDFLEALRATRMTAEYRAPDKLPFFGLVPESISHEGYSARPVHSYWDDFFTLRGFEDAVYLAGLVSDPERVAKWSALRDDFRRDLYASLERTMKKHAIDFLPGSVELGDFDATSTAAAVTPGGELPHLPAKALAKTFDLYLTYVRERAKRPPGDEGYTPYELRNVDALIHMGRREDAYELLRTMLEGLRPPEWHQWGEIVWRDPALPRFIGDTPHTWVASSFLSALRNMLVYERSEDSALVLGAGLPAAWVLEGSGVSVERLPTADGILHYRLARDGPTRLHWWFLGDVDVPAGGIVLAPPVPGPLTRVTADGKEITLEPGASTVTLRTFPTEVELEWAQPPSAP